MNDRDTLWTIVIIIIVILLISSSFGMMAPQNLVYVNKEGFVANRNRYPYYY